MKRHTAYDLSDADHWAAECQRLGIADRPLPEELPCTHFIAPARTPAEWHACAWSQEETRVLLGLAGCCLLVVALGIWSLVPLTP